MDVINVLLIEDNPADSLYIREMLSDPEATLRIGSAFDLTHCERLSTALDHALQHKVDVALLDLTLPDSKHLETFRILFRHLPEVPIIVLTGLEDEALGVTTINEGAQDYLVKGEMSSSLLLRSIRYAIQRKHAKNEITRYRDHLEKLVVERTQELAASQEKLRQSERMASIGALSAGIAHEINNPVGAILLIAQNAQEMKNDCKSKEELSELLSRTCQKVTNNAKRCALIVKGILQFSRQQSTEKWPHNVTSVIESALQLLYDSDERSKGSFMINSSIKPLQVVLNPLEMEQVFVNLFRNALESGVGGCRVVVDIQENNKQAMITVEDNGAGIAEEALKHIFDPFYTTRQRNGGTGLGLSIAHGIIIDHGGTIEVESTLGVGTKVVIHLPLMQPKDEMANRDKLGMQKSDGDTRTWPPY